MVNQNERGIVVNLHGKSIRIGGNRFLFCIRRQVPFDRPFGRELQNTRSFDLGGDIDLVRNHVGISRLPESFHPILEFRNDQFINAALLIENLLDLFQLRFQLFPFLQTGVVAIDGQFQHAHVGQGTSL